jgi:short-chain fatty acids transporter
LFALAAFYLYAVQTREERGLKLDLNSINFIFFMLGAILHGTPRRFINAVTEGTPKIAPILIQYPLYAGIMAILQQSGLAGDISQWFVEHSTAATFPLMTFYSAGMLNVLVPSGGGQWAVQAPIVIPAAQELGVSIPRVAMAVAWGDAWTNMLQPFWAVPLLTIAGLSIKDIIGFCLLVLLASGVGLSLLFLVL